MLTNLARTRMNSSLPAWLGLLIAMPVVVTAALLTLAGSPAQGPPPLAAARVHHQLPALHGQLLSLKYIAPLNSYRIRLLNPQGQILSYEQEARSGRLLGLKTQPAPPAQLPAGLLPLETLLRMLFGTADFQLLAVRLDSSSPQASYVLDWVQDGVSFHAHFDARKGWLLQHPQV